MLRCLAHVVILQPFVHAYVCDSHANEELDLNFLRSCTSPKTETKVKLSPFETPFESTQHIFLQVWKEVKTKILEVMNLIKWSFFGNTLHVLVSFKSP